MNWKNRHREDNNGFATHQPVLEKIISLVDGPILELGCGEGSTELIHHYSVEKKIQVLTIESDKQWMERYTYLQNENHEFIANENLNEWENLVDEWTEYLKNQPKDRIKKAAETYNIHEDLTNLFFFALPHRYIRHLRPSKPKCR